MGRALGNQKILGERGELGEVWLRAPSGTCTDLNHTGIVQQKGLNEPEELECVTLWGQA